MIIYTTKINKVRCADQDGLTDVVKQVDFILRGEDAGCSFELPSSIKTGEIDPQDFVQFADLTEAHVLAWVEADPTFDSVKSHIAMVVQKMVAEAALEDKPMPWAPPVEPAPGP